MQKNRAATYIKNGIKYKRGEDLEPLGGHMIVLNLEGTTPTRLVNLYRPFTNKAPTEIQFFTTQLLKLN